eukprot:TRINITY_DN5201_c0_g1_i1.p1 TRINITY_DN5201_c0_g1~~TRINITY_DN5201_c0_g1_i1.p1  ORF type:complete len:465 (-),score=125.06 TRINITY_DN5201_c0_g1_i1:40-1434(-)
MEPPSTPFARINIIPNKLDCSVYKYDLVDVEWTKGLNVPLWIFVTEGMDLVKQAEFILIIKVNDLSAYPTAPMALFKGLFVSASLKGAMGDGYLHTFGDSGFIKKQVKGILFQQLLSEFLPEEMLNPSKSYLLSITLLEEEVKICKSIGATRVLALLGNKEKCFPYPPWSDLDRASVVPKDIAIQDNIITKAPHINAPECYCLYQGNDNKVVIKIPNFATEIIKPQLDKIQINSIVIFESHFVAHQDGQLLWKPEKIQGEVSIEQIEVSLAPSSKKERLGGSFFGFVPEQAADETIIYEDGFLVLLTDNSWQLLRKCLCKGSNCFVQSDTPKGLNAEISFYQVTDEATLKEESQKSKQQLMILTAKEDLEKRTSTEKLTDYANSISKVILEYLPNVSSELGGIKQLILQFDLEPNQKLKLKVASMPPSPIPEPIKTHIHNSIFTIPILPIKNGPVQFQIYFPLQ